MTAPSDDFESVTRPPRREWVIEHLRPYLLGLLSPGEEDQIADSLFYYPGISTMLDEAEHQLLKEFATGTLQLDPVRNASLIRRWAASPETRAGLEVLRWKDEVLNSAEEPVTKPATVTPIRAKRPTGWWVMAGSAAAGVVLALLIGQWYSLQQQKEQMAKAIAEGNRRAAEAERLRQENERLSKELASAQAQNRPLPESPKTLTPAQREIIEAQLAGSQEGILEFRAANREITLPSQQPLYWRAPTELVDSFDVIVTRHDGAIETRRLKAFRGKVEIPIEADDLPAQLSIRRRQSEETLVSNIKVVHGR